jgi:outer membrane lipoprotein-sorting protein
MSDNLLTHLAAALLAAALAAPAPAADTEPAAKPLTAMDIVRKANRVAYYQGADGRAKVKMVITDAQGRARTREMTILRRDQADPKAKATTAPATKDEFCGEQKFYVYFHRPADVNKMSFLVWKRLAKDDDRWLYLPGLDLVKRISSADKRTSFVGSHFFYEDVSGRNIHDDTHELTKTSRNYYLLKSTPKKPGSVEFGHFVTWVHRATFVVVKQDYFDRKGVKHRTYQVAEMDKVQGFWTATKSVMIDHRTKGKTVLAYSDIKFNVGVPEEVFTERYLRRAPRAYLR